MAFYRPAWAPSLTDADIPDDLSLSDFIFDDRFRPRKCEDSPYPFIDSISGTGYDIPETRRRIDCLAAGLANQLDIDDISGDVWQRVVGLFTVNNVSQKTHDIKLSRANKFRFIIRLLLGQHTA